ncbi:MAG: serine/threonine-protein kinase [Gemmatimonadota bacterium]
MSSPRRKSVGRFTLESILGRGAQGEVWRAKSDDGDFVALKLFPLGFDEDRVNDLRRRVSREVTALKGVENAAIVKALEMGEDGDQLFVAYELIDGEDLHVALRAPMPPSTADCLSLLKGLAPGLDAIHSAGLLHRDLKPSNIVLRGRSWSAPVIVDFGYVKQVAASRLTMTGFAVGTSGYLAPEVSADPKNCSVASDQWSLAQVITEVLTVALAMNLTDFTTSEEMRTACEDDAPNASAILATAGHSQPTQRFSSVVAFADAFRAALIRDELIELSSEPATSVSDWSEEESLVAYFSRLGCQIAADKRPSGSLWIIGDFETLNAAANQLAPRGVALRFASGGGRATKYTSGWWTQSAK